MIDKNPKFDFPKTFLWGASTAAHQVEGDTHNQWTVWELENAQAKSVQAEYRIGHFKSWDNIRQYAQDPNNYVSGMSTGHYNRFKEDFDLLQKMNMNAYRFSIEWSRIEPNEGQWDDAAIKHYQQYIDELKKRDIEPIVTLFHFALPVWFADMGGFARRSNVKYFTRFAKKIVSELGDRIKLIITINEPEIYTIESYYNKNWPPAESSFLKSWRVINNLAYAHCQAAKAIHKLGEHYRVSIAKNSVFYHAGDDAVITRLGTFIMQFIEDDYVIRKVVKHCDFLGVNYYMSNMVYGYKVHNPEDNLNDLNWDMRPEDIQFALERLYKRYKLPIIITENGLADSDDSHRKWWITQTIMAMQKAIKNGVKLQGYLHWSLVDNFEWAYGKWPRFGLVAVDYKTGERKLRSSAIWFGGVIKKLRGIK